MKPILALVPAAVLAAPSSDLLKGRQSSLIQITSATYQGSGCPPDTIVTSISSDGVTASLSLEALSVSVGPNSGASQETCQVAIAVRYPIGCTSSVTEVTFHGYGQVDDGITGSLTAQYSLSAGSVNPGSSAIYSFSQSTLGPGTEWVGGDNVTSTANVQSAGEQDVTFTVSAALGLTANGDLQGLVQPDNLSIAFKNIAEC